MAVVKVTAIERERCIPGSWREVEGDSRTKKQMAHSSARRGTSSLWVKDKKGDRGT